MTTDPTLIADLRDVHTEAPKCAHCGDPISGRAIADPGYPVWQARLLHQPCFDSLHRTPTCVTEK